MAKVTIELAATGTRWLIDLEGRLNDEVVKEIAEEIKQTAENFENNYSRFRNESLISRMSRQAGVYSLPEDARELFDFYFKLNHLTEGQFTPLVGEWLDKAGYDTDYSFKSKGDLEKLPRLEEVLRYDYPRMEVKKPYRLDLGAAGKGYLIDILKKKLESKGIETFTIDGGGDLFFRTKEERVLRVGLENPQNSQEVIGVAELRNKSLCGSAGNRRQWADFHHILSPESKQSPTEVLATWVIAESAIVADGLATSLFLVTPKKMESSFDFEYLRLKKDFSIEKSDHFPAELFEYKMES